MPDLVRLTDGLVLIRFESMKVYSALAAVRHLLERGTIRPGQTLVDSSSGIYAYALALACHRHGMRCHIVASTTVDTTTRAQLEVLGATVEQVRPSKDLKLDQELRVRRVEELLADHPDWHWMRQYHDAVHYLGYHEVADRIAAAFPGAPLTVVGGVGSGASTGGVVERLRSADPSVRLVGVQPFGSVTFGSEDHHDPEAIIAGIGSSIVFDNVRHHLYDAVHWLDFTHAMAARSRCCGTTPSSPGCPPAPRTWPPRTRRAATRTGCTWSSAPTPGTATSSASSPGTRKPRTRPP